MKQNIPHVKDCGIGLRGKVDGINEENNKTGQKYFRELHQNILTCSEEARITRKKENGAPALAGIMERGLLSAPLQNTNWIILRVPGAFPRCVWKEFVSVPESNLERARRSGSPCHERIEPWYRFVRESREIFL